jgi:catechol 2,3-dioxygenase-like lactoylglutathione lyase family enzyme
MEIKRSVVRLIVSDFRRSYRFYRDGIGLSLDFGTEDDAVAEFDGETVLLTLVDKEQVDQVPPGIYTTPGRGTGDRSVLVFTVPDLAAAVKKLAERGIRALGDPVSIPDWQIRVVYFRDPDDNLIEIQELVS